VTGVIDWSDAALVDPAADVGRLYRDPGPAARRAAIDSYRTDRHDLAAFGDRAVFYAGAAFWKTWHTPSERDGTPTSTHASPRWSGCSWIATRGKMTRF